MKLKTLVIVIISLTSFLISCSKGKSETKKEEKAEVVEEITEPILSPLYANYITAEGSGNNQTKKDSLAVVSSDYFEVNFSLTVQGDFFAERTLYTSPSLENFKMIFFIISDKDGNELRFQESTEFLNFMAKHGYDFISQTKHEYRTEYIFKKNKTMQ